MISEIIPRMRGAQVAAMTNSTPTFFSGEPGPARNRERMAMPARK